MAATSLVTVDSLGNFLSSADSGFETGNGTGWTPIYMTGIGATNTLALDGSSCLAMTAQYANYFSEAFCTTTFPVVGGRKYYMSGFARAAVPSAASGCACVAYWYTSPGVSASVANTTINTPLILSTTAWQEVGGYVTAPPDALLGLILFYNFNTNIGDIWYLDRVIAKNSMRSAVSGSKTTIGFHKFISNLEQGDNVYPAGGTDANWQVGYATMTPAQAPDGTVAFRHDNPNTTAGFNAYGFTDFHPASPGQFYRASVRVWGPADRLALAIGFYPTGSGIGGGGQAGIVATTPIGIAAGGWTTLICSGIAPVGTVTAQLVFTVYNGNGTTSFYTTDWQLTQENDVIARTIGMDSIVINDTTTHTDIVSRAMIIVRQYTDILTQLDGASRTVIQSRLLSEILSHNDVVNRSFLRSRMIVESLSQLDISHPSHLINTQLIHEILTTNDTIGVKELTARRFVETLSLNDLWILILFMRGHSYDYTTVSSIGLRKALNPMGIEIIRPGALFYPDPLDDPDSRPAATNLFTDIIKTGATLYPVPVAPEESS